MARKSTPHHLTIPLLTSLLRWDGLYMFHCHNLIHEDHDMMAAFNVTALKDLGYDEKTHFIDPMEPQYRAKPFADADFVNRNGDFSSDAIEAKVKFFQNLEAYKNVNVVETKLEEYWATRSTLATVVTKTSSGGGGGASVSQAASGLGSSSASVAVASSAGSTLVTSVSSAKLASSTTSDDKGGKKTTSSSTAKASSTKK
jgi:bilirubin oxidase